jgi:hypothetical protein
MRIWIVTWIAEGDMPGVDVFAEPDKAMDCLRYMVDNGRTATVKSITINQQQNEQPEEKPEETEEGSVEA